MSTTTTKLSLADAKERAEDFRSLFHPSAFQTWTIAGSVRRKAKEVGDIEHVVIANFADIPVDGGLFSETRSTNLVWQKLDQLIATSRLVKHIYGIHPSTGQAVYRWGQKYRGVEFDGITHEVFCCEPCNYGATLAIRTGPPDFSKRLVTGLLQRGRRNKDGYVWNCTPCTVCAGRRSYRCEPCDGTGLMATEKLTVMSEEVYFELCGVRFVNAEARR